MQISESLHSFNKYLQSFPCVQGPKWGWGWRPKVVGHVPSQRLMFCTGKDSAQENIHILSGRDGAVKKS